MGKADVLSGAAPWIAGMAEPFLPEDLIAVYPAYIETKEHDRAVLLGLTPRTFCALSFTLTKTTVNGFERLNVDIDQDSVPLQEIRSWRASWSGRVNQGQRQEIDVNGLVTPGAYIEVGRDLLGLGDPLMLPLSDQEAAEGTHKLTHKIRQFLSVLEAIRHQ